MNILDSIFTSAVIETLKILGIFITCLISCVSLYVNLRSNKRTAYIKEITTLKHKYISDLRQQIAEFASKALEYQMALMVADSDQQSIDKIYQELQFKYNLARLYLNYENSIDEKLGSYLEEILKAGKSRIKSRTALDFKIKSMLKYSERVLLFEWQNLKHEARFGPMSNQLIHKKQKDFNTKNHQP